MKILILCASGNSTGFTFGLCQRFRSIAEGLGHVVELADLSSFYILDCDGCAACSAHRGCSKEDDFASLSVRMDRSDLVVFASPVHFNGPSSILKRFMDRCNPYWHTGRKAARHACALLCGGSEKAEFRHILSELRSLALSIGSEWAGEVCVAGTDVLQDIPDMSAQVGEILDRVSPQ